MDSFVHLVEYSLNGAVLNFENAQSELLRLWGKNAEPNTVWGYYSIENASSEEYSECMKLQQELEASVIVKFEAQHRIDMKCAFMQYMPPQPSPNNGKLHLDITDSNAIERNDALNTHILRLLLNAHSSAERTLQYLPVNKSQLENEYGYKFSDTSYSTVEPPEGIEVQEIKIPPRTESSIWGLHFLGDDIPHAGFTTKEGQFLISYGGYKEY